MKEVIKYDLSKHLGEEPNDLFDVKTQIENNVQKVLDSGGELPGSEYDSLYNHIAGDLKPKYLNGSDKDKALSIREMNMKSDNVKEYKAFREQLAAAYNTKALMSGWVEGAQGKAVMSLLRDEPRLVQKKCDENMNCADRDQLGVVMPDYKVASKASMQHRKLLQQYNSPGLTKDIKKQLDGALKDLSTVIKTNGERWMSISSLKKLIRLKDSKSKEVIRTVGNNWLNQAFKTNPAEPVPFNEQAASQQVRSSIVKKAKNLQSLAYDEMIPGRIFYEDVQEKIMKTTQFKRPEDAIKIANALINDPENKKSLEDELTTYYTGFLKKQWEIGERNKPKSTKQIKEEQDKKFKRSRYVPGYLKA